LSRERRGKNFVYRHRNGTVVRDAAVLKRIKSLVIPPAWTEVWVCAEPNGHIQATGRDARGRKQYRYHARFRWVRDEAKYSHILRFARVLPKIRRRVEHDLDLPDLPREKVLATIVRLLERTMMRIGNDEYARTNNSFGLSTLRNHHARVRGRRLVFDFRGKSGVRHHIEIESPRLARIIRRCRELPGQHLFEYRDAAGNIRPVGSHDVNDYLREISGEEITAKDFRTWAATNLAAAALCEPEALAVKGSKKAVVGAVKQVAAALGNTVAVCRKCYIHPAVFDGYVDGSLAAALKTATDPVRKAAPGMTQVEAAVAAFLRRRLKAVGHGGRKSPGRRAAGRPTSSNRDSKPAMRPLYAGPARHRRGSPAQAGRSP
jgi:DNA topoisomerase-1